MRLPNLRSKNALSQQCFKACCKKCLFVFVIFLITLIVGFGLNATVSLSDTTGIKWIIEQIVAVLTFIAFAAIPVTIIHVIASIVFFIRRSLKSYAVTATLLQVVSFAAFIWVAYDDYYHGGMLSGLICMLLCMTWIPSTIIEFMLTQISYHLSKKIVG